MSLFGSLYASASGMQAQTRATQTVSSNIANSNTVGYKRSDTSFQDTLGAIGSATGSLHTTPSSITTQIVSRISQQGSILQTGLSTDLSIGGEGFFAVNAPTPEGNAPTANSPLTELLFTRAGEFTPNGNGILTNVGGYALYGYPIDIENANALINTANTNTAIPATGNLEPVDLSRLTEQFFETTQASLGLILNAEEDQSTAALPANLTTPADFTTSLTVYDNTGTAQPLRIELRHITGTPTPPYGTQDAFPPLSPDIATADPNHNFWEMTVIHTDTDGTETVVSEGMLHFTEDGQLATDPAEEGPALLTLAAQNLPFPSSQGIQVNLSGIEQKSADYSTIAIAQNGDAPSAMNDILIEPDGTLYISFANGRTQASYRIPVITFNNPNGLSNIDGTAFQATDISGAATLREASSDIGSSLIQSGTLEASNVDMGEELTTLIISQRAYAMNSQMLQAVNEMTQTAAGLKG